MISGADTTFLIEAEVAGHTNHAWARRTLDEHVDRGDTIALAPQVLAEFVHVVTDPKRFSRPLTMEQALSRADQWWQAREVVHALPTSESCQLFMNWMRTYALGRKRLLDTMLASTYHAHGIRSILSSNSSDYAIFGCFTITSPS